MGSSILKLLFFVGILHLAVVPSTSTGDDDFNQIAIAAKELKHDEFCPPGTPTAKTALVTKKIRDKYQVKCGTSMKVECLWGGCKINPETGDSSVLVTIVGSLDDGVVFLLLSQDAFITIAEDNAEFIHTYSRLVSAGSEEEVTGLAGSEEVTASAGLEEEEVTVSTGSDEQVTVSTGLGEEATSESEEDYYANLTESDEEEDYANLTDLDDETLPLLKYMS